MKGAYGGVEGLKKVMNAKLAGIQGSGWAWLVKDKETGAVGVRTYAVGAPLSFFFPRASDLGCNGVKTTLTSSFPHQNQDPVIGQFIPLLGIDAWEHAY